MLDPSIMKGLFVGYNESSKAYKIYILEQSKKIVGHDVKFEEIFVPWVYYNDRGWGEDICFVMKTLSQFRVEPRQEYRVVAKHVPKYLREAMEYGLRYLADGKVKL